MCARARSSAHASPSAQAREFLLSVPRASLYLRGAARVHLPRGFVTNTEENINFILWIEFCVCVTSDAMQQQPNADPAGEFCSSVINPHLITSVNLL